MIGIGCDYGGPERKGSLIHTGLNAVARAVADQRDPNFDDGTAAWINPIFLVPGSIYGPDDMPPFKLGHFSKGRKGLVIMIRVPDEVADGSGIPEFVEEALFTSVEMSSERFQKAGITFSEAEARALLDAAFDSILGWRKVTND